MIDSKEYNLKNIHDVFGNVYRLEQDTFYIDISKYLVDGKQRVLAFREPGINEAYGAYHDAKQIRTRAAVYGNDIPIDLCQTIALLARCHVTPKAINPLGAYLDLSKHNGQAFEYIAEEFCKHVNELYGVINGKK